MLRNPEQIIGNLIEKQNSAFIASVDGDGFPNMKAMLSPRKREGIRDTMYYFGGVTDPDYCVLKFTAQSERYYANFKSEDYDV